MERELCSSPGPRAPQVIRLLGGKVPFLSLLISLLRGYHTNMDWEKEKGNAYPYFVYGASCSEVEVDCLTGAHKVKSHIGAHHLQCSLYSENTNVDAFSMR